MEVGLEDLQEFHFSFKASITSSPFIVEGLFLQNNQQHSLWPIDYES